MQQPIPCDPALRLARSIRPPDLGRSTAKYTSPQEWLERHRPGCGPRRRGRGWPADGRCNGLTGALRNRRARSLPGADDRAGPPPAPPHVRRSGRGRGGGRELAVRCMPWPITNQSRVISSRQHPTSKSRPAAFPTLLLLPGFQGRRAEDPRAASACGKESRPSLRPPRVPRPAPLVRVGAVVAGRGEMN